ncbi:MULTISPECIES: hypothetical protein [unclassified Vibrio]|uniref:hypothetical protein n=1 Tax=unclassified Vibrio TaxID=2614977 RepID=UPI001267942F|nr:MULTISPECIES: hypothetical protein [unclassified Vibrio]QFT39742.1 hypothetical protein FIU99_25480 [Vibrio sp. THAF64]QGM37751.1 hypothetical protein GGC04_26000 [Vibrio sp. THAF191d]QGN73094.1 hypothetical protein GGC03_25225 [Vibrio sp. THAF191c]
MFNPIEQVMMNALEASLKRSDFERAEDMLAYRFRELSAAVNGQPCDKLNCNLLSVIMACESDVSDKLATFDALSELKQFAQNTELSISQLWQEIEKNELKHLPITNESKQAIIARYSMILLIHCASTFVFLPVGGLITQLVNTAFNTHGASAFATKGGWHNDTSLQWGDSSDWIRECSAALTLDVWGKLQDYLTGVPQSLADCLKDIQYAQKNQQDPKKVSHAVEQTLAMKTKWYEQKLHIQWHILQRTSEYIYNELKRYPSQSEIHRTHWVELTKTVKFKVMDGINTANAKVTKHLITDGVKKWNLKLQDTRYQANQKLYGVSCLLTGQDSKTLQGWSNGMHSAAKTFLQSEGLIKVAQLPTSRDASVDKRLKSMTDQWISYKYEKNKQSMNKAKDWDNAVRHMSYALELLVAHCDQATATRIIAALRGKYNEPGFEQMNKISMISASNEWANDDTQFCAPVTLYCSDGKNINTSSGWAALVTLGQVKHTYEQTLNQESKDEVKMVRSLLNDIPQDLNRVLFRTNSGEF